MTLTRAVIATALASLAGQAPQQPVFRAGIDIVQVDVSVLDRDRRPVRGLAASDFTVLEDGKPQEVMVFTAIEAPTADVPSAPWMREIPRDVRSNDLGEARLFAIIMDDAATPPSLDMARTARQIGHRIVEQLGPADLAAVIFTRDNRYAQDFTTERSRLRAAIDRFMPGVVYGLPGTNERSDSYSFYLVAAHTQSRHRVPRDGPTAPQDDLLCQSRRPGRSARGVVGGLDWAGYVDGGP